MTDFFVQWHGHMSARRCYCRKRIHKKALCLISFLGTYADRLGKKLITQETPFVFVKFSQKNLHSKSHPSQSGTAWLGTKWLRIYWCQWATKYLPSTRRLFSNVLNNSFLLEYAAFFLHFLCRWLNYWRLYYHFHLLGWLHSMLLQPPCQCCWCFDLVHPSGRNCQTSFH